MSGRSLEVGREEVRKLGAALGMIGEAEAFGEISGGSDRDAG